MDSDDTCHLEDPQPASTNCQRIMTFAQQDSPLLKLPPELRNDIYECTISNSGNECFYVDLKGGAQPQIPALLRVCRQMRHEASPIFFSRSFIGSMTIEGEWIQRDIHSAITWLHNVGAENSARIKKLELCCDYVWISEYLAQIPPLLTPMEVAKALVSTGLKPSSIVYVLNDVWAPRQTLLELNKFSSELQKVSGMSRLPGSVHIRAKGRGKKIDFSDRETMHGLMNQRMRSKQPK